MNTESKIILICVSRCREHDKHHVNDSLRNFKTQAIHAIPKALKYQEQYDIIPSCWR